MFTDCRVCGHPVDPAAPQPCEAGGLCQPTTTTQEVIMTSTITRPHQVTAVTVEPGDILREGYGTLTITTREVLEVHRWRTVHGVVNARVTFTNGETETIYAGTHIENRRYYMQRDGVPA